MSSYRSLDIPPSPVTVSVKIFDLIPAGQHKSVLAPAAGNLTPVLRGYERLECPIFAFLIEHADLNRRVMFDLGLRKDMENTAPSVRAILQENFPNTEKDIVDLLEESGINVGSVDAIIWRDSHSHVDHTGDPSRFPASTDLVCSSELALDTFEQNPQSTLLPSDLAGHKHVKIDFSQSELTLGDLRAHDYFGDGSFYLLDVPGHQAGHMCGLARVTSTPTTSFVLMGGDACHHAGILRPTDAIYTNYPCLANLLEATRRSVSTTHFPCPVAANETQTEFLLGLRSTPLLDIADGPYQADPALARRSLAKLRVFDANLDVFVVMAHDASLLPLFTSDSEPVVINEWKKKGWKDEVVWAFLDEGNPAFRFREKD
ncbi:Metallo-beta-lactamase superfamily protein [Mycena kentingensis (nom. inval.)]|nr:Metallo-beta-lactamase superfamily protein [Mycena kentingensis (nom. inval.)]